MKNVKMLVFVLAGLMIETNIVDAMEEIVDAMEELETAKVASVSGLCENLGNWNVFGSIGASINVVWNAREIAGAIKTDVLSGTAFAHLASGVKEARKSDYSILSYPAFFCDLGLSSVGATYNAVTHPAQTMADVKAYAYELACAEWLVLTDRQVAHLLNDSEAVERLKTKKTD